MKVFVSRPSWVDEEFETGMEEFLDFLKTFDLEPRTLGVTDYPNEAPLDEVIKLLDKCSGAVILGYPQITISEGMIKNKKIDEDNKVLLATEWNHIEATLAYSSDLPLLIIHHIGVKRGVFDRGTISSFIYEKDLSKPEWSLKSDVRGAIKNWKNKCLQSEA